MHRSFVRVLVRSLVTVLFGVVVAVLAATLPEASQAEAQTVGFTSPTASVSEGNGPGTVNLAFPIQFSAPPPNLSSLSYSLTPSGVNQASAGADYVDTSGAIFVIGCLGATCSPNQTINIQIVGDTTVEPDETFTITITSGDFTINPAASSSVGTILNDDSLPLPNLTITDVTQAETNAGTTTFTFTISLSAPAGPGGVTFDIATADGTAQDDTPAAEDNDYVAQSLTGQTITTGNTTYTFNVTVNGDAVVEPNETFVVNVANVTGANAIDPQGQGTITNDDSAVPGLPNLTINDVTRNEGDAGTTTFAFTVSLSAPAGAGGVTFDIATADTTATAGSDYVAQSLTGQTIGAGLTSTTFNVAVNGDAAVESSETYFVNVTAVVGATVVDGQGVGTIAEDDGAGALSFTSATAQVAENAGTVTLTVQRGGVAPTSAAQPASNVPGGSVRSNPAPSPAANAGPIGPAAFSAVAVNYATTNGTATAGQDYTTTSGTLNFGVGETTKTIVVPILPDTVDELPETFTVTLSAPTGGAVLGAITTATVTITDVDTTPCQTTLSAAVPSGSNVLPVISQAGCNVGDTVAIDPGLPNEDRGTILGFGSIVIQQPTTQAHAAGAVVIRVAASAAAAAPPVSPGDDSADDERVERERETEEERRQRARTNQGNKDDDSVEGDVIETHCDQPWPAVVIANRDGAVEVKLLKEAQRACTSIQVGDYLEADGEKQHEGLFHADSVEIKHRR